MLEVRLLGTFEVKHKKKLISIPSRPAQSLFAYLILTPDVAHRREKLAGLLWPDSLEETARDNLRHALWRLRKALESASSTRFLHADDLTITFKKSPDYLLDAAELEKLSNDCSADELMAVLANYEGELLSGFYEEWVVLKREHLSSVFEHHMARLMSLLQDGQRWLDVLEWGERWIKLGQKPEPAFRALMMAHAAKGDMSKVAATYERCVRALKDFGVEPSTETSALYEGLKSGMENLESTPARVLKDKQLQLPKTNLPIPLTSFIGREREIEEVRYLLSSTRLLTLTGTGGIGKTRLAIQAAHELLRAFKDGVWWVELAPVIDSALVPQALAQVLSVRAAPDQSLTEAVKSFLREKQALLLLDNCEHLVLMCSQLADDLLSQCANLRIMATSREVLGVMGEAKLQVPPLSSPAPTNLPSMQAWNEFESIQLFLERAEAAHPELRLTQQDAFALTQICQRLDGIPLAIELAAARVRVMSVEEIARRLNDRFNLLTSGSRTVLPRHQTLLAAIDWSYDLLTEPERLLFRRLSVFVGGFTLEAAEAICGREGLKSNDVLDLLGHLVNKSLVNVLQANTHSDIRYQLLETIREYLLIQLQASNETSMMRDEHLKYFTTWVEETGPKLVSREQALWFHRVEMEMDNLRVALDWSMSDMPSDASRYLKDNTKRLKAMQQLELCYRLGDVLNIQAKYTEALDVYKVMLKCAQDLGDVAAQSRALQGLAYSLEEGGDYQTSLDYARQAETLARSVGSRIELARALWTHGVICYRLGEAQAVFVLGEEALSLARETSDLHETARSLNLLGASTYILGKYDLAEHYWQDAKLTFEELGDQRRAMDISNNLGSLADAKGDYEAALRYYDGALQLAREFGYRDGEIVFLSNRGGSRVALKKYHDAEVDLRKTIEIAGTAGSWCLPNTYAYLAEAYLGQEIQERALETALYALALAQDSDTPEYIGVAWRVLGIIAGRMGKSINVNRKAENRLTEYSAEDCFKISEEIFIANGIDVEQARTLREWSRYKLSIGNRKRGMEMWQEARQIFEKLGAHLEAERMKTSPI